MPYVHVFFDPTKIDQAIVDKVKPWLQPEVAETLSSLDAVYGDYSLPGKMNKVGVEDDIRTTKEEIFVYQHEIHPTDVNAAPLEIHIEAGAPKGRSGDKVQTLLGLKLSQSELVPDEHLGEGNSCIFINFHEHNGFGFVPNRRLTQGD